MPEASDQFPLERRLPHLGRRIAAAVLAPLRAFRTAYLPLLMVYLASGALGLVAVADSFWVKTSLTLTPLDLATLAVWLQLPWSAKMVVSELVDCVPLMGSRRRSYLALGAGMIAAGLALLAGAAGGCLTLLRPERAYALAQLLIVGGAVIQEVVADAMSAEVVPRHGPDGADRPQADIEADLAMVQVLARLGYSIGAFLVAWLSGILAEALPYATVFLIGLVIPALSLGGALLVRLEHDCAAGGTDVRPVDRRILGGGSAIAGIAVVLGLAGFAFAQEIVFLVSLAIIILMLSRVMTAIDADTRRLIAGVALMSFAFRAVPTLGDGYRWYGMDVLGFDERFFGTLQLTGTGVGLLAMWLMTGPVMRLPVRTVMLWLTFLAAALWLPSLLLVNGVHAWTEVHLGIGARGLALVDEASQTPLALLAVVPLMTLIAVKAPAEHRATWFALSASLMSLAIVAGQLVTKYLNLVFPIDRGAYANLPSLVAAVLALSLVLPLAAIGLVAARRARAGPG